MDATLAAVVLSISLEKAALFSFFSLQTKQLIMAWPLSCAFSLAVLVTSTLTDGVLAMTATMQPGTISTVGHDFSCPPGMECVHGYCPAGSVSCVCHPGWAGFQCEQACPADCSQNAACQTTPEGTPYCLCDEGLRYVTGRGCVNDTSTTAPPGTGGVLLLFAVRQFLLLLLLRFLLIFSSYFIFSFSLFSQP